MVSVANMHVMMLLASISVGTLVARMDVMSVYVPLSVSYLDSPVLISMGVMTLLTRIGVIP